MTQFGGQTSRERHEKRMNKESDRTKAEELSKKRLPKGNQ